LAINGILGLCAVATAAGIYSVVTNKSTYQKKDLLRILADSAAVPTKLLMTLATADNPADILREKLQDPDILADTELSMRCAKRSRWRSDKIDPRVNHRGSFLFETRTGGSGAIQPLVRPRPWTKSTHRPRLRA
jgi:hypothetical protein